MSNEVIYAIGDIHGRDDLLADLHDAILANHPFMFPEQPATLLYIGDYIDRGGNSLGVIDRVMHGLDGFETIALLGNHEAMMMECLETDDPKTWSQWLQNGGLTTLGSLGVSFGKGSGDPELLQRALGPDRIAWLRALRPYYETERALYVHAGIAPGVPLAQQDPYDLLWIRGPFLDSTADHGRLIVHGHTPEEEVVNLPNRLGIDTGAVHYGRLTAAIMVDGSDPKFLYATGEPGKGPRP